MLNRYAIAALAIAAFAGCSRSSESKLVGRWQLPGTPIKATFRADHTFQMETSDGHNSRVLVTGSWRCEGDQLLTTMQTTDGKRQDSQERYTIITLNRTKFVYRRQHEKDEGT